MSFLYVRVIVGIAIIYLRKSTNRLITCMCKDHSFNAFCIRNKSANLLSCKVPTAITAICSLNHNTTCRVLRALASTCFAGSVGLRFNHVTFLARILHHVTPGIVRLVIGTAKGSTHFFLDRCYRFGFRTFRTAYATR